jgi:RNA polymerase sigma factor (sigma-70 family)
MRANRVVLGQLRTLFNLGAIGDLTDGQLLERFATHDPEAAELAFAALVERHGPMVLRVCRSALSDQHDADDAFQATFLVLVQKARSLWVKDSLGPWLHRVAHRIATRARYSNVRRRDHEQLVAVMKPVIVREHDGTDEIGDILHDEIDRLTDRHRIPIVICDLQGLSHEKAARHLGWPVGTVKSRLAKAREILRGRLSRRGLGPHAGLLVATRGVTPALGAVENVVPTSLAESTVAGATVLAAGKGAEAISAPVIILIAEGLKTMFVSKLRLASIALLFFGAAAATTVGVLAQTKVHPMPRPMHAPDQPAPADARRDRGNSALPADDSVPAYITHSRAMIVTRLEEELAEARARLDRTLRIVRSPDDPVAVHTRKTVDALNQILARIDAVLVDAVDAYPTMFDFSGGPAAVASQMQMMHSSNGPMVGGVKDPRTRGSLETEFRDAWNRLKWSEAQFERGYVSKSTVDLNRRRVDELKASLDGKPDGLEPPDRQEMQNGMQRMSSRAMGMGSGNDPENSGRRLGTDVRSVDRMRQHAGKSPAQNQSEQAQPEQNELDEQSPGGNSRARPTPSQDQQQQPQENQTRRQNQQPPAGQNQAATENPRQSQDQPASGSHAKDSSSSNSPRQDGSRSKQGQGQGRNRSDGSDAPQSQDSSKNRDRNYAVSDAREQGGDNAKQPPKTQRDY